MHERPNAPLLLKLMMDDHALFIYVVAARSAAAALGSEVVAWGEVWSAGPPASSAAPGDVGVGSLVPTAPVSYTPSSQLSHTGLPHAYLASMLVVGGLAMAGPPICCWMA